MSCSNNGNAETQASASSNGNSSSGSGFCVVNFYQLLEIPQPLAELELHRSFIADANLDLKCDPAHHHTLHALHVLSITAPSLVPDDPDTMRCPPPAVIPDIPRGRIYISGQGVNAQYSGPSGDALAYADWLKGRDGFESLRYLVGLISIPASFLERSR